MRDTSGSYAVAGLVSGAYALSFGLLGPAVARLADRTGPVPALRTTAMLHPVLLGAAVVAARNDAPLLVLLLPTTAAGATVPPLGPVMRALWADPLRPSAGVLLAVWAIGTVVGGLVHGGLDLRTPHRSQLPVPVTALAAGTALPLLGTGRQRSGWRCSSSA